MVSSFIAVLVMTLWGVPKDAAPTQVVDSYSFGLLMILVTVLSISLANVAISFVQSMSVPVLAVVNCSFSVLFFGNYLALSWLETGTVPFSNVTSV